MTLSLVALSAGMAASDPVLVKDININPAPSDINPAPTVGSDPEELINVNGTLFFHACAVCDFYDYPRNGTLWKSDGQPPEPSSSKTSRTRGD